MNFLYESVFQIVTWVFIALSVGFLILFISQHNWKGVLFSAAALLCSTIIMLALIAQRHFAIFNQPEETQFHGVLTADDQPTPPHPCDEMMKRRNEMPDLPPINNDEMVAIHYGNSATFLNKLDNHVVLNVEGDKLLSITKTPNGVTVSARVFSQDTRIVAEIIDNEFHINPNNYFRIDRPDRHSLTVHDQQGERVLKVDFLNPRTVRVLGIFRHPKTSPIIIDEKSVRAGGNIYQVACSLDSKGGILIGNDPNER